MTTLDTRQTATTKSIKPRDDFGLAIIGPFNTVWTDKLFKEAKDAYAELDAFWGRDKWKPEQWSVVDAAQTIQQLSRQVQIAPIKLDEACQIKQQ